MKLDRQQVLVGLLVVVGLWAVWFQFSGDESAVGGAPDPAASRAGLADLPPVIAIAEPRGQLEPFDPSGGRNLFAYAEPKRVAPPPPPPPPRRPRPQPQVKTPEQVAEEQRQAEQARREVEPPRPQPPAVNFKFVGYMGPQTALIGVFRVSTPDGEEVVLAREGEVLAEKFRVHRIGYEEVEIGYTAEPFLNERKVLPMGGQS